MKRPRTEYASIRLPVGVAERIDTQLARDDTYASRSAWVKVADLRRLEELE